MDWFSPENVVAVAAALLGGRRLHRVRARHAGAGQEVRADCPNSEITVDAHGSNEGLRELAEAAGAAKSGSPDLLVLSDGPKPAGFTRLNEDRVAVAAFALVVNRGSGQDVLKAFGHVPCYTPDGLKRCTR